MTLDRRAVGLLGTWLLLSELSKAYAERNSGPLFFLAGLGVLVGLVFIVLALTAKDATGRRSATRGLEE